MFKFKASYVALAAVLTSSVVYADPTSYTHSSGATVIDIEKPNAAGVSHNLYRDFNVGTNGTILNNSGDDVSHSTFGNIARNNNLTAGSASVILNEVTSKNASSLKGFIEVNGQKADVVIANPNGITCSGCSFVNTNKAILTTGKVNMTDDGAIGSYTVTGGTLTIGENGMNAANGYAVLLADAIKINGKVQANNALVSAGNFTMDNSSGSVTSAGKKATLIQMTVNPQYSIDVSSLGGIEANSISMVGNNIGFGVRNKGSIISNGTLMLTSNGNLLNKGSITGKGLLSQVSTVTGITNDGSIAGAYYLMLSSGDYIVNTGSLSGGQLIATANGNITNGDSGTMTGTSGLSLTSGGKIRNEEKASLLSNNQIAATAIGDFLNEGKISAKHTSLTFVGDSFKNTGNINSTGQTTIQSLTQDGTANTGEIYNLGNITGENINLQTNGTLAQSSSGRIEATNAITAHSYWLNQNGYMNAADITTDHGVVNNYGNITAKNISITTYSDITNEGQISSTGDLTLNTKNKGAIYNYSTLSAGGNMTLTATKVVNGGKSCGILGLAKCGVGTLTADKLVLNSSQKYVSDMGGKQYFKSTEVNTVKPRASFFARLGLEGPTLELIVATFWTARQHVRGVYRQVIVALLADQVAQTDHFAAVVHAVMIQILKDFPPLELGFVGDISQLLPQALFDHPHKHAVALVFVTLFVAAGKLLEVAFDRRNHRLDLALRQIAGADDFFPRLRHQRVDIALSMAEPFAERGDQFTVILSNLVHHFASGGVNVF